MSRLSELKPKEFFGTIDKAKKKWEHLERTTDSMLQNASFCILRDLHQDSKNLFDLKEINSNFIMNRKLSNLNELKLYTKNS